MMQKLHLWAMVVGLLVSAAMADQSRFYVRADRSGDGDSWSDAYGTICEAFRDPELDPGDEIWVSQGTYFPCDPDTGPDRTRTFPIPSGVKLYGNFFVDEFNQPTDIDERDFVKPREPDSKLSGLIGLDWPYHLVSATGTAQGTIIDGFQMYAGDADDANGHGALINVTNGHLKVANCYLHKGFAYNGGGGAISLHTDGSGSLVLEDVDIDSCVALQGGGVYSNGPIEIRRSRIKDCEAQHPSSPGGALHVSEDVPGAGSLDIRDSVLFNNRSSGSPSGGGLFVDQNIEVTMINVSMTANRGDSLQPGNAIHHAGGTVDIDNSIIWSNGDHGVATQILNTGTMTIDHSAVDGITTNSTWGTMNIGDDPLFLNASLGELYYTSPC